MCTGQVRAMSLDQGVFSPLVAKSLEEVNQRKKGQIREAKSVRDCAGLLPWMPLDERCRFQMRPEVAPV